METRFDKFIKLGQSIIETTAEYWSNGHRVRTEDYFDIKVLPDAEDKFKVH